MLRNKTILTADDDAQVRLALRTRLTAEGCNVIEASDGLGAIAKCRAGGVDALILDHQMPLGEGGEIVRNLRTFTRAPIIFLSGMNRDDFRDIVHNTPDTYFLPKPVDYSRLNHLLCSLLEESPDGPSCSVR